MADRIAAIGSYRVAPRWMFVRLSTAEGVSGWGEAIVPKRAHAVEGAVQDLSEVVIGSDPDRIEDAAQRMRTGGFFRGGPILGTAAAAIEQALWDVKGQRYGLPVYQFLGGATRDNVRCYAWVGGDRPHQVVEDARSRVAQGYSMIKMNATQESDYLTDHDQVDGVVERVGAIRDTFGHQVDIAVDFHGRVHRGVARTLIRELDQFGLAWIEEPLAPGLESSYRSVFGADRSIPIATGERLTSRWSVAPLLAAGIVDIIQPDVSLTGIFELEKITRMAETYDVAVAPHCPNGPVSLAASLQVAACAVNIPVQEQSLGLHYNRGYADLPQAEMFDYLTDPEPLTPVDGSLPVPQGPGLGITVDPDRVDASPPWNLTDPGWRHPDGRVAEW